MTAKVNKIKSGGVTVNLMDYREDTDYVGEYELGKTYAAGNVVKFAYGRWKARVNTNEAPVGMLRTSGGDSIVTSDGVRMVTGVISPSWQPDEQTWYIHRLLRRIDELEYR